MIEQGKAKVILGSGLSCQSCRIGLLVRLIFVCNLIEMVASRLFVVLGCSVAAAENNGGRQAENGDTGRETHVVLLLSKPRTAETLEFFRGIFR